MSSLEIQVHVCPLSWQPWTVEAGVDHHWIGVPCLSLAVLVPVLRAVGL